MCQSIKDKSPIFNQVYYFYIPSSYLCKPYCVNSITLHSLNHHLVVLSSCCRQYLDCSFQLSFQCFIDTASATAPPQVPAPAPVPWATLETQSMSPSRHPALQVGIQFQQGKSLCGPYVGLTPKASFYTSSAITAVHSLTNKDICICLIIPHTEQVKFTQTEINLFTKTSTKTRWCPDGEQCFKD